MADTSTGAIVVMVLAVFRKLISLAIRGLLDVHVATRIMVTACVSCLERYQE